MLATSLYTNSMHNTVMLTGGWALVTAGILFFPLPGPFSTPALTLGGIVLVHRSSAFRHLVAALRARFPETSVALSERSRRWPRAVRYIVLRTDPRRIRLAP